LRNGNPGKKQEQRHESNHDERDKAGACEFSHVSVRHTRGIPVRDYLIGEHRVRGERDEEGEDEAGDVALFFMKDLTATLFSSPGMPGLSRSERITGERL